MLPYLERREVISQEEVASGRQLGWLERLDKFDQEAHAAFRTLYEKVARGETFPRGFTRQIKEFNDRVWVSLSFSPTPDELRQVPQDLRMLLNDLGIKDIDKTEVTISFRTKKSEDGKPGEYERDFSFEIKPQERTENMVGILMRTEEDTGIYDHTSGRRPSEKGENIMSLYGQRDSKKKISSKPVNAAVLKSAAEWIGGLLDPSQNKKTDGSNVRYGWIEVFRKNEKELATKIKDNISGLFNLVGEKTEGVTLAKDQGDNAELSIEIQPEDFDLLPEAVESLLVDLGISEPTQMEMIVNKGWASTLQLQPRELSKTKLGIVLAINFEITHQTIAPKRVHYYVDRGFREDDFDFSRKVQEGYGGMPVFLKVNILNEILRWGQDIVNRRKALS